MSNLSYTLLTTDRTSGIVVESKVLTENDLKKLIGSNESDNAIRKTYGYVLHCTLPVHYHSDNKHYRTYTCKHLCARQITKYVIDIGADLDDYDRSIGKLINYVNSNVDYIDPRNVVRWVHFQAKIKNTELTPSYIINVREEDTGFTSSDGWMHYEAHYVCDIYRYQETYNKDGDMSVKIVNRNNKIVSQIDSWYSVLDTDTGHLNKIPCSDDQNSELSDLSDSDDSDDSDSD
jgi:hypothetical protein